VTPFADNDAGLAVSCTSCGQITRVPGGRAAKPKPVLAYEPPPALGRVRGSGARPYVYAVAVVLAFLIVGAMGFLRYRSMAAGRARAVANLAADRAAATALAAREAAAATAPATTAPMTAAVVAPSPVATRPTTEAKAAVTAKVEGPSRVVGFVGVERLELNGRYSVDSYDSAKGPFRESSAGAKAPLVSRLKVRLFGDGKVGGVVRVAEGADVKREGSVKFLGGAPKEPERGVRVDVPSVDVGIVKRENDNRDLPEKYFRGRDFVLHAGKTVAIAGGVYYLEDLVVEPKATLVLDGPATFVVTGKLIVQGNVETHGKRAGNFQVRVAGESQPAVINNASDVYVDLYAPGRTVEIYGSGDVYGSVVGKTLRVNGERGLHFDESIAPVLEGVGPRH
jgi:hypothetical protein